MGLIKPPWVSKTWFNSCPFNYCDHFGDKEFLFAVCRICKAEVAQGVAGKKDVLDSQPIVFPELPIQESLDKEDDLFALAYEADELVEYMERFLSVLQRYGNLVARVLTHLYSKEPKQKTELVEKVIDVLSHSRTYCYVKLRRAWRSKCEEYRSGIMKDVSDSKTSALFTYIALERNSRAFLALAKNEPNSPQAADYIELSDISIDLMETIRKIFFPSERLRYTDAGCEAYDRCFAEKRKKVIKYHRD